MTRPPARRVWASAAVVCTGVAITLAACPPAASAQATRVLTRRTPALRVPADSALVRGRPSGVEIAGLAPGDTATLVAWRRAVVRGAAGRADTVALRASGTFAGAVGGRVRVDDAAPAGGTWARPDPYALLWSMERRDSAVAVPLGRVLLRLERRGRVLDSATLAVRSAAPGTRVQWVAGDGFAGAFATVDGAVDGAPGGAARRFRPAIILLHGSEGGDSVAARADAEAFAAQGYAAFALTYFAWGGRIPGVPGALVNVPLETLDRARAWLGAQPGVDTSRTALWGASKGGEFALVVAARRAWPRAVVACVPSDVVWSGFGRAAAPGERLSSWSDGGASLPFVPYDRYEDVLEGRLTSRAVHDRSRARAADSVPAATIPISRTRARLLLLGSDRDEVWASGPMVRALADTLRAHGRAGQVAARTYPLAGHQICGTGAAPALQFERTYPTDTPTDARPDAPATAAAGADAWRTTVAFLRAALR